MATRDEIVSLIEQAAQRNGVSPEALMAIANIESSGNVNAQNPRSSASGLFQFVDRTAREYGLTGSKRNDPAAQAEAAAQMMAKNARSLERSLGRTPQPGELYLAHQQGLTGATALLTNPDRPAVDVLTQVYGSRERAKKAVALNGGNLNQSAGQFSGQWVNKANQRTALIPPGSLPSVATQLDVRRPITPSMPTAMSPQLAAQRNLASMLGSGQFTAPGSEYANAYTSTPRSSAENAIAQALTGGQTSRPSASFYNGIYAQQPATARDVANVPYSGGSTVSTISTQPRLTAPRQIDNSVNNARMGQDPATAAALQRYISQPPPSRNTAPSPSRSAIRADNGQTGPAYTPPRAPAVIPAQNGRALQRQEQTQRLQPRISTVASIPTTPQRTALPPIAPSSVASPRMISTSMERAAAAQDPRLAAALSAPRPTPAQPTAAQRAAMAYVPPATQSRIGQPPATRVVPSVPVPGPMNGVGGALPTWEDFQRQFAPPTPGPNNPIVKSQDRLTAGVYPRAPIGPELPGVASALSVIAPRQPSAFPTSASLRPTSVQGYPTPVSQRPASNGFLRSAFGLPTPSNMRPASGSAANPLRVTVTGANTQAPSSSSSSSPSSGYVFQGQQVYATPTKRYNTDTNTFETITTYKPR